MFYQHISFLYRHRKFTQKRFYFESKILMWFNQRDITVVFLNRLREMEEKYDQTR